MRTVVGSENVAGQRMWQVRWRGVVMATTYLWLLEGGVCARLEVSEV